jgi:ABC-type sugar transport system ATPase subunit
VLRDGAYVATFDRREVTSERVVSAMVGRPPSLHRASEPQPRAAASIAQTASPLLEVRALSRSPHFDDVSLRLAPGDIVGLFGLVGSGRSELLETVFGLVPASAGTVLVEGRPVRFASARDAARAGIVLVPEERQRQGLFFNLRVRDNLMLPSQTTRGAVLIRPQMERREADALLRSWRIKAPHADALPDSLSGGNQQKVVLAKWLATAPRVLLLDEPTKGVDVGAKFEIHDIIRRQAAEGAGCLVASSDLPEVLALCNRIVVMREGRIQGELAGDAASEELVMRLATHELRDAS